MLRPIHGFANLGNAAGDSGGRFIVHNHYRFDRVLLVFFQPMFGVLRLRAAPPVSRYIIDNQPMPYGDVSPQIGKMSGLKHQDSIAR
jgi:hypothetical protein